MPQKKTGRERHNGGKIHVFTSITPNTTILRHYLKVLTRVVGYDQRITGRVLKYALEERVEQQRNKSSKAYFNIRPVIRWSYSTTCVRTQFSLFKIICCTEECIESLCFFNKKNNFDVAVLALLRLNYTSLSFWAVVGAGIMIKMVIVLEERKKREREREREY